MHTQSVHRIPALVAVVTTGEDDIHIALGKQRPDIIQARRLPCLANVEHRMMEVDDRTDGIAVIQIVHQPVILICSGIRLIELAARIQADDVPAFRVKTIIMRHIIPVIEITERGAICIFLTSNRWVRDGIKA